MMVRQDNFENVIFSIRIPLIIGVVLIHSSLRADASGIVYLSLHKLVSELLAAPCVPLFFLISGFLFFYRVPVFSTKIYVQKLKKRIKTLLLPYLFWNFIVIIYYTLGHLFFPNLISPNNCNILEYSFEEVIRSFWDYPGGFPICFQFWYIRNLMVLCVFSPFFYWMAKKMTKYVIILYLLFYLCLGQQGFVSSILFFSIGSYLSIRNINVLEFCRNYFYIFCSFFVCGVLYLFIVEKNEFILRAMILGGMVTFTYLMNLYISHQGKSHANFDKSSFFIYGFHGFPLVLLTSTIFPRILGMSDAMCVVQYLLAPIVVITLSAVLFNIMQRICPSFLSFICGSR